MHRAGRPFPLEKTAERTRPELQGKRTTDISTSILSYTGCPFRSGELQSHPLRPVVPLVFILPVQSGADLDLGRQVQEISEPIRNINQSCAWDHWPIRDIIQSCAWDH